MKKILKIIGICLAFLFTFAVFVSVTRKCSKEDQPDSSVSSPIDSGDSSEDPSDSSGELPEPPPEDPVADTLNARLANATGEVTLELTEDIELTTAGIETVLGGANVEKIVIDGGNVSTITATGVAKSAVKAANNAELVFKNLTIEDETAENGESAWKTYLYFGGDVTFENCTFGESVYLSESTFAYFSKCTFTSATARYGAWVGNGSAIFENCTFTGCRGLKIHEFTEEKQDVRSVYVNGCLFSELTEKVGIAIGEVDADTEIYIADSSFNDCQAWDSEGSLVGIHGFYESDTLLDNFEFIEENNEIVFDENKLPWVDINDDAKWTKNY